MYDMIVGFLRAVVPALVAWMVAKGWFPEAMSADLTTWIMDAGVAIITLGAGVWSVLKNRKSSQIARVAAMDEVAHVQLKNTAAAYGFKLKALGPKVWAS